MITVISEVGSKTILKSKITRSIFWLAFSNLPAQKQLHRVKKGKTSESQNSGNATILQQF